MITASFHPVIGGAETYAYAISSALRDRGHEVTVVTDHPGTGTDPTVGDPPGVSVHRLTGHRTLLADPSKIFWEQMAYGLFPEIAEIADRADPQVVLTNSLDTAVLGKTVALDREIPWVATSHEQAPEREPMGTGRLRLVYEVLAPDLVLAGSDFYAMRARAYGARCAIVYHGVDCDRFRPGPEREPTRRRYGVAGYESLVVCSGRLKERKGIREAVEAVAMVRAKVPDVRLLVVGGVSSASLEYAEKLEERIRRPDLAGAVQIDRSVSYDEMPAVLAAADIVVQPSLEEGLGLAVLEAMSTQRPVVTTDIPGTREILTTDGIAGVVVPRDVPGLAAALRRFLDFPEVAAATARRARNHVIDTFSWRRMAEQTETLLVELVNGNNWGEPADV